MNRKLAIVTGVSRLKGIGRAICHELASQGIDIFFTYWTDYDNVMPWKVDDNEPDLIQEEIRALGVNCEKLELDLSNSDAIITLFDAVEKRMGKVDVLVNNATYSTSTNIENISSEELDKHYKVNLRATTLLTIEFIRRHANHEFGRIVNLISGESLSPMPEEIAYAITKGAIETLTKTLSQTIASKGITVNAVNPGPNDTGWIDDNTKVKLLKRSPKKRLGTPTDAAKLIGFLVSEDGEWITGQIIHSEGGFIR